MLLSAFESHLHCRSGSVVSVCNIDLVNGCKGILNLCNLLMIRNLPHCMRDSVHCRKIIQRLLCLHHPAYYLIDLTSGTVCQKDRSCLRTQRVDMTNTILFLLLSGILMLLDHIVKIIINACTGYNSGLCSAVHRQPVDIICLLVIRNIYAVLLHLIKQLGCLIIYSVIIGIHIRRKLCLRPVDLQKRKGFSLYFLRCLLAVIYIIRKCRNSVCKLLRWSYCLKRFYLCHSILSTS